MSKAADRVLGILLFLPVPAVLWLFTRLPLRPVPSLALGAVVMLTHPLYARPFARRHASRRCLWCGGEVPPDPGPETALLLAEPRGLTGWRTCGPRHRETLQRVLGWAEERQLLLRAGIVGALVVYVTGILLGSLHRLGPAQPSDAVAFFRLAVALTVLPLGWTSPFWRGTVGTKIRTPFPVHIQALIGTWAVLWLFRVIGLLWLVQGLAYFASRIGLSGRP